MSGPTEDPDEAILKRYPTAYKGFSDSERSLVTAWLKLTKEEATPDAIQGAVLRMRERRTEPTGQAWSERLARNNGVEYRGGPVCWDPEVLCEGVCLDCPIKGRA